MGSSSITLSIFHHLLQLGLKTNQSILSCLEIFLESSEYDLIRPLCCLGLVLGQGPLDLPWDAGLVRPQGPSGLGSVGSRGSRSVPRPDAWVLVCQRAAWGSHLYKEDSGAACQHPCWETEKRRHGAQHTGILRPCQHLSLSLPRDHGKIRDSPAERSNPHLPNFTVYRKHLDLARA